MATSSGDRPRAIAARILGGNAEEVKFADGLFTAPRSNRALTIGEVAAAGTVSDRRRQRGHRVGHVRVEHLLTLGALEVDHERAVFAGETQPGL